MEEKVSIMSCDNSVVIDEVRAALEAAGIESEARDETISSTLGTSGLLPTVHILVNAKDQAAAEAVADKIKAERDEFKPWCPACGSEDVEKAATQTKPQNQYMMFVKGGIIAAVVLCVGGYSGTAGLFIGMGICVAIGCLVFIIKLRANSSDKYVCKNCGKTFSRA